MSVFALADFKTWARVEHDDDDASLQICLDAAETYFAGQTGETLTSESEALAQAGVFALAALYAENREAAAPISLHAIPFTLRAIIAHYRGVEGLDGADDD